MGLRSEDRKLRLEIDAARLQLLRRRFSVLAGVVGGLVIAKSLLVAVIVEWRGIAEPPAWAALLTAKVLLGIAIATLPRLLRERVARLDRRALIWQAGALIVLAVVTQVVGAGLVGQALAEATRLIGIPIDVGPFPPLLLVLGLVYTAAALVVPWSAREAALPLAAMTLIVSVGALAWSGSIAVKIGFAGLTLLIGAPGLAISWYRHSQLRTRIALRLLSGRFELLHAELRTARRIHERLFPRPFNAGPLQFDYRYRPMQQLGGDYLQALPRPDGSLLVIVVDVTGHGVAAAVAVNRLHGEIKRILALDGTAGPAVVVRELNRYVLHTLADEQHFATALALRVHPARGVVEYANGGHPAPLLWRADGTIGRLPATMPMLGVLNGEYFDVAERVLELTPGDLLLAYTDGVTESPDALASRDPAGWLERLLRTGSPGSAADTLDSLLAAIDAPEGAAADDRLLVALAWQPDGTPGAQRGERAAVPVAT